MEGGMGHRFWLVGAAALVLLGGCSASSNTPTTSAPDAKGEKKLKIGVVFDKGGVNDKSFNESAKAGLDRAAKELGIEAIPVESRSDSDYESNLEALADKKCDLVMAVGITMQTALQRIAKEHPDTKFAIIDGSVDAPNVRQLLFKEEEGSYLVGYIAGLTTKTNKLGFVGGMKLPLIEKFEYGYMAGAKAANPAVEVLPSKYVGSWDNVDAAKTAATVLFNDGADVVYHAAGLAGLGVIRAAEEKGKFAIGVDKDQDDVAKGFVLTSMVKKVDEALFSTVKDLKDGAWSAGAKVYDLKAGGVGTSPFTYTKDKIGEANIAKLDEIKKKIISGEIKVPTDKASYDALSASK